MTSPANPLRPLAEIVGEPNASTDPERIGVYAIDGQLPRMAVWPSGAEEIAEILRCCAADKLAAVPAGGATKLRIGATPARYDVAVVLTRLDKIAAYDPGDLTISVEAGARLGGVSALLAKNRQLVPLPVPFLNQATAGGTVSSGIDSPLRQLYGTARDFLLGLEFVTGDGVRAKSGGRVVKNVAGYDLHKLFIGSLGTLGVITRLNFKTFPLPEASGGFVASFADESAALELLRQVRHSPLRTSTLEILNPTLADGFARRAPSTAADTPQPGPWLSASAWTVAASFGGSSVALERYRRDLESMAGATGATESAFLAEDSWIALRDGIRETIPLILDESPAATIVRVSVLPSRLGEIFAAARRCGERCELPVAILARAVGVAYVAFLAGEANEPAIERLSRAAVEMSEAVAKARGFSLVGWCPPEVKSRVPLWGKERNDLPLMRKVKQAFDPRNILSPGRFMGGF